MNIASDDTNVGRYLQEHVLDQALIELSAQWTNGSLKQDEFLNRFEVLSLSCLHKTTLQKIALNSTGSADNAIKNENLLRFDTLFKITASIISNNIDVLESTEALSKGQANTLPLKNFLLRVIDLLCKLLSEFEIWDIYTLHQQLGRFLEYCIDLDYIFALLHLTTKLMTINESGDPHYFDPKKNMEDVFTFLMPVFGLLESFNNNLDAICAKMRRPENLQELVDIIHAALKFAAPESKLQVGEFVNNILSIRKSMKEADLTNIPEQLASSKIFSSSAFLDAFPEQRRQKYFIRGLVAFFFALVDQKIFEYARNAFLYSALVVKSSIFLQGEGNKGFIREYAKMLQVNLIVPSIYIYDVSFIAYGLRSLRPQELALKYDLRLRVNLYAGKLILHLAAIFVNPFHYKCIVLDGGPLNSLEAELYRIYEEPPKEGFFGKIFSGSGPKQNIVVKPAVLDVIDVIMEQLKNLESLPSDSKKPAVPKDQEREAKKYLLSFLSSVLESLAAPNNFLRIIDKKGRSKLTGIVNTLIIIFIKFSGAIEDCTFELPQLLKSFAQILSVYPFALNTLPKGALAEFIQQYSRLFLKTLKNKSPNSQLDFEYDLALTNAYASFLLILAYLPAPEVREEIIKAILTPELSAPQTFEDKKSSVKLQFVLAFANISFVTERISNAPIKSKTTFPAKSLPAYLKSSNPALTILPLALKLSNESATARDIMLESQFLILSGTNVISPAKTWRLSSSNRSIYEYYLGTTALLNILMTLQDAKLRDKLIKNLLETLENSVEKPDSSLNVDFKYCVQDLGNSKLLLSKIFYNCFFKDCYFLSLRCAMETAKSWPENKGENIVQLIQQYTTAIWTHIFRVPIFLVRKSTFDTVNYLFRYSSGQEKFEFLWKIYQHSELETLQADMIISCFVHLQIDPKTQTIIFANSLIEWIEANKSTASQDYEVYLRFLGFITFCDTVTRSLVLEKIPEMSLCSTSEEFITFYEQKLDLNTMLPKYILLLDEILEKTQALLLPHETLENVRHNVRSFAQYLLKFIIIKSRHGDVASLDPYFDLWKGRITNFLKNGKIASSSDLVTIQTDMLVFEIMVLESVDQTELITLIGKHNCFRYVSDTIASLLKASQNTELEVKDDVIQVIHRSFNKDFLKLLLKTKVSDISQLGSTDLEKSHDLEKHWKAYIENILIFISKCFELIFHPNEQAERYQVIQKLFGFWSELSVSFLEKTFIPILECNESLGASKKNTLDRNIEFLANLSATFLEPNLRQFIKETFTQNDDNLMYLAKEQRAALLKALVSIAEHLKDDQIHNHWGLVLKQSCGFLQSYNQASNLKLNQLGELQIKLEYWFELAGKVRDVDTKIEFWVETFNTALKVLSINSLPEEEIIRMNFILLVLNESINAIGVMSREESFTQKYGKQLSILLDLVLKYFKIVKAHKTSKSNSVDLSLSIAILLKIFAIFTALATEHGFDFKFEALFKENDLIEFQGEGQDHIITYILAAALKFSQNAHLSLPQILDAKIFKYRNVFSLLADNNLQELFEKGALTEEILSKSVVERYQIEIPQDLSNVSSFSRANLMRIRLSLKSEAKYLVVLPEIPNAESMTLPVAIASHIQKLYNQLCLFNNIWDLAKLEKEQDTEEARTFNKLVQMIRILTELIKVNSLFTLQLFSMKLHVNYLLSNPLEWNSVKDVNVDLATLIATSILPIIPTIVADNFLESLCSYHQVSFLVRTKESVTTNDSYFTNLFGETIFKSLSYELRNLYSIPASGYSEKLGAYTLLLQSIYKNIEYRTKEQTAVLSKKINDLLELLFSVWEQKLSGYLNHNCTKLFLNLVHNIYTIVQDSTLLAIQRFFFGEDYSKFLHQYSEDVETISKQVFSSNMDFSKFIEEKSGTQDASEEKSLQKITNKQVAIITSEEMSKKSDQDLSLFEQNLGEDFQHIKMANSQEEFVRELGSILKHGKDQISNQKHAGQGLRLKEFIYKNYGLKAAPEQIEFNPIDYIMENLKMIEVDSKEQQNKSIKEELLSNSVREFSLIKFFKSGIEKGLQESSQKVSAKLTKMLEYSMCDRFEKLLSKGRFDTKAMAKMDPDPKFNEFIERLPVKQIIVALALIGEEYHFLLNPNLRGLAIVIKQKIKSQNLQNYLYSEPPTTQVFGLHSVHLEKDIDEKDLRPSLESAAKTAQLILQNTQVSNNNAAENQSKFYKLALNKRFKSNYRHIYDHLEKKCQNYEEMVYYLNRTENARRADAISVAEENIIKINSINIENFLTTACYLQAVAPHSKDPYLFFEILLDLCVQPVNQIQILDATFSMLRWIEKKTWSTFRYRSKMLKSVDSKEAVTFEYLLQFLLCVARSLKSQLFLTNNFGKILVSLSGRTAPLPFTHDIYDQGSSSVELYLFELVRFLKASQVTTLSNEKCGEIFIKVCLGLQDKAHLFSEQFKAITSQDLLYDKAKFKFSFQISNFISQNMVHIGNNPSLFIFGVRNNSFLRLFNEELLKVITLFLHSKKSLEQLMEQAKKRSRGLIMGFFDNLQIFRKEEDFVVSISVSLFYINHASTYLKSITAGLESLTKQMQHKKDLSITTLNDVENLLKETMSHPIITQLFKWCNETLVYYAELRKELTVLDSAFFKTLGNQSIQDKRYASLRGIFGFIIQVFNLNNKRAVFKKQLKKYQAIDKGPLEEEIALPVLHRLKTKAEEPEEEKEKSPEKKINMNIEEKEEIDAVKIDEAFTNLSTVGKSLIEEMFTHDVGALESNAVDPIFIAPWLFSFTTKKQMIQAALKKKTLLNEIFNIQAAAAEPGARKFRIRREHILEDTLNNFDAIPEQEINHELKFNIEYHNEVGQDLGGLTNEWLNDVISKLIDPKFGLFQVAPNKISIQPSPLAYIVPNYLKYFRLAGRLIGYSVANAITLKVSFTKPFLKLILDSEVSASDLNDIDTELYRSLQWMLENSVEGVLGQDFAYEVEAFGKYYTINITPDGSTREVSDTNKKDFVKSLAYSKLVHEIDEPLKEFKKGLFEIVPRQLLKILLPSELLTLLAGEAIIDVKEMRKYAQLQNPPSLKVTNWFWEVIEEFDQDQLSNLMFFITGHSNVAVGGFQEHPIKISSSGNKRNSLPISHTCFNMIHLPEYSSKQLLKEKLIMAMVEGKGFYLA